LSIDKEMMMSFMTIGEQIEREKRLERGFLLGWQEGYREGFRQGFQEGLREGLIRSIEFALTLRFGREGLSLLDEVRQIRSAASLDRVLLAIETASMLDEIRKVVSSHKSAP